MSSLRSARSYLAFLLAAAAAAPATTGCSSAPLAEEQPSPRMAFSMQAGETVKVDGRKVLVGDAPYQIKGMNYSPTPIGGSPDAYDAELRGTGGDFFASDYFEPQWRADIAKMREMGVNTIRVYQMHPWQPQIGPKEPFLHKKFLDALYNGGDRPIRVFVSFPVSPSTFRYKMQDTKPTDGRYFVERVCEGKPCFEVEDETSVSEGWKFNGAQTAPQRRQTDHDAYVALAKEVGSHPAVLGFVVANELNGGVNIGNPKFFPYFDGLAKDLHEAAPGKLTMMALFDDGLDTVRLVSTSPEKVANIDVWGINSYRGSVGGTTNDFGTLFTDYAKLSEKPLVVSEFGAPSTSRKQIQSELGLPLPIPKSGEEITNQVSVLNRTCPAVTDLVDVSESVGTYYDGHWKHIDLSKDLVVGGIAFEWNDEYWKAHDVWNLQGTAGIGRDFPGGCWDEASFGIHAVRSDRKTNADWPATFKPDQRVARPAYDVLKGYWIAK
jgi:hypothetical protein